MNVDKNIVEMASRAILDRRKFLRDLTGTVALPSLGKIAAAAGVGAAFSVLSDPRAAFAADTKLSALSLLPGATQQYAITDANASGRVFTLGWVNVKDYGATGNGSTDDTTAIQAAVTASGGNATIYFPPGQYKVTATIDLISVFSTSLTLLGAGQGFSVITGTVSGFIFESTQTNNTGNGSLIMNNLGLHNASTSAGTGCVHMETGITIDIHNCAFFGIVDIALSSTDNVNSQTTAAMIRSCHFECADFWVTGTMAIFSSALDVTIMNCTMLGFDQAVRINGTGHNIINCQMESNNFGVMIGKKYDNSGYQATGVNIIGGSFENNFQGAIYIHSGAFVKVQGSIITFGDNVVGRESVAGIVIDSAQQVTIDTVTANGPFTTAGINILNVDNVSKVLFINSAVSTSCNIAAGTKKSNLTQINCANFGSFATTVTLLPGNAGNTAELPSYNDKRIVTDATVTTFNSTVAGGGGNTVPVTYNGSNWIIG